MGIFVSKTGHFRLTMLARKPQNFSLEVNIQITNRLLRSNKFPLKSKMLKSAELPAFLGKLGIFLAPQRGLEPPTYRLGGDRCYPTELLGRMRL